MFVETAAAISSLKSASEIAKAMLGLRDAGLIQTKTIELQREILSAYSSALNAKEAQSALFERIRDLEAKIVEMETWEREKERYKLTDYGGGTFAYALKEEDEAGEPPHRICAVCFQKKHKSILQFKFMSSIGRDHYECPECSRIFAFGEAKPSEPVSRGGDWMSV